MSASSTAKATGWLAHAVAAVILGVLIVTIIVQGIRIAASWQILPLLVVTLTVGWLLGWKRPRNPIGWMLLAIPGFWALTGLSYLLGTALLAGAPGAAVWLLWFGADRDDTWTWIPPIALLFSQIPLRFPDGRLLSPRWRWFFWYSVVGIVIACALFSTASAEVVPGVANPIHAPLDTVEALLVLLLLLGVTIFGGSIASLVVRYRRGGVVERAQLRWVLWGAAIAAGGLVVSWFVPGSWTGVDIWQAFVTVVLYPLVPTTIGIAVLRYRLYEIDRIISRTVGYAIVTATVVGTYIVVVLSLGLFLPDLPAVGVALATLAAAAVFLPMLRWVQRAIDRRFDHERYDAERVVDAFGRRLRDGADPSSTAPDLIAAVEQTLAPASVGLWVPGRRS